MLPYSVEDVQEALSKAKNLNAAVKKFLKVEVGRDVKAERFAKSMREVAGSSDRLATFVKNSLPDYEAHLLVLTRHAYQEPFGSIAQEITDTFAEEFNATYTRNEKGEPSITDKAGFKRIAGESLKRIEAGLEKGELPKNGFMKNVLVHWIFEKDLVDLVIKGG
jgi:hypothetical protein